MDSRAMDNNDNNIGNANTALATSFITGLIAWIDGISWTNIDWSDILKTVSMVVSIGAGIMAIRYYYYSTKKNK